MNSLCLRLKICDFSSLVSAAERCPKGKATDLIFRSMLGTFLSKSASIFDESSSSTISSLFARARDKGSCLSDSKEIELFLIDYLYSLFMCFLSGS